MCLIPCLEPVRSLPGPVLGVYLVSLVAALCLVQSNSSVLSWMNIQTVSSSKPQWNLPMNGSAEKQYIEECAERAYNKAIYKFVFGCLVRYLKHTVSMYGENVRLYLSSEFLNILEISQPCFNHLLCVCTICLTIKIHIDEMDWNEMFKFDASFNRVKWFFLLTYYKTQW